MRGRVLRVLDLGRRPYGLMMRAQERLALARRRKVVPDLLLLLEHEPVYTLGRNALESHVLISERELRGRGLQVIRTGRGGDVTYHGPGQLVGYPILDLAARGEGPLWYVDALERTMVRALSGVGVEAGTDARNRGVWVGRDKIAAIGVRITRGITMHGFALNVCTDLRAYEGIVPCGLHDRGVTSVERMRPGVTMARVKTAVVAAFRRVFGYEDRAAGN